MGQSAGWVGELAARVLFTLPFTVACSGESGNSSSYDAHLPPAYTGPAGALTRRTPCPAPIAWPQTLTFNEVTASYDSTRGRILYTSHDAGGGPFFLWEWDNATSAFTLRTPCGANIPRDDTTAAYDPDIRAVLLLGGASPVELHVDTGVIEPITSPAGTAATYFYDPLAKGVIVTNIPTDPAPKATSLRWDDISKTWKPSGLGLGYVDLNDRSWALDPKREKIYMLAGDIVTPGHLVEVDMATGTTRQLTGSDVPPELDFGTGYAAAAFDSRRDRLVYVKAAGTWEYDLVTGAWSMRAGPDGAPALRGDMASQIVFDEKAGLVTLFEQGPYEPQVFTWDGTTWKTHRPAHIQHAWPTVPFSSRPKEMPFALTYDADRHRTLLFAASDDTQAFGNTMEWDGKSWVDRTPADPTLSPPSRSNAALTYDRTRHRAVLYGDENRSTDLWEWDGDRGTWTNRTPSPLPTKWPFGDDNVRLAFNPVTGAEFLYEGTTWQWHGATGTWSESSSGFIGVDPLQLLFDERLGRIVLLGTSFGGLGSAAYDDGAQKWEVLHPAEKAASALAPGYSGAAYDSVRGTIALFGGAAIPAQLVEYDMGDGSVKDVTPATPPEHWPDKTETAAAMAYDTDRGVLVILTQDGELFERSSR